MLNFLHKLIMALGILCVSIGLTAQIIPPPPTSTVYYPTYNNQGAMDFYISYPSGTQRQPFTSISNIKKPSSTGKINYVIAVGTNVLFIPTFTDIDYAQSINNSTGNPVTDQNGNVIPPAAIANNSNYKRTVSGHPNSPAPYTASAYYMASPAISTESSTLPSNKYSLIYKIEDLGPNPTGQYVSGSLIDSGSVSLDIDLWVMTLMEVTRTIKLQNNQVYPISLEYTPDDFPHENICYIVASWGYGFPMPGMPAPASNLYTDPECTNAITGDTSSSSERTWKIPSVPKTIYYKKPTTGGNSIKLILRMKDGSTSYDMLTRTLTFANADMLLKSVDTQRGIGGYWTGAFSAYPTPEWLDHNEDGNIIDPAGSDNDDNNRPFVFSKADNEYFSIDKVVFKKKNSSYNLTGKTLSATSNLYGINASGIAFPTPTGDTYEIVSNSLEGDAVTSIGVDDVTITWSIADNNTFTSTHKVYVVGGAMSNVSSILYHTLVDLGCEAARGKTTDYDIFVAICNRFKTDINRIDGEGPLKYWGSLASENPAVQEFTTVTELLTHLDGRCGAWAKMLAATLKIQGVTSLGFNFNIPLGKTIQHNGHDDEIQQFKQVKSPFKGGTSPPNDFTEHTIVRYGDYYFDPTGKSDIYSNVNNYYVNDIEVQAVCPDKTKRWIPGQKSYFNTITGSLL